MPAVVIGAKQTQFPRCIVPAKPYKSSARHSNSSAFLMSGGNFISSAQAHCYVPSLRTKDILIFDF
jgi:hypothetical protein